MHRDTGHGLLDGFLERLRVAVNADQHPEHQLPSDHHLLDVQQRDAVPGECREEN
jgi:hypothetical protein